MLKKPASMWITKRYKMVSSDFQNFEFLIQNFSKNRNFRKNLWIKKNKKFFWIKKKTEYMFWRLAFAMPMPNFEAIRQFLVIKLPKKPRKPYISNFWIANFGSFRPSTKTKVPPLNLPSKTESDIDQFCFKRPFQNLT